MFFCTKTLKLHWKIVKIFLGGFAPQTPQTFTNFIDSILQVINQMWHNITRLFWKVCLSCSPRKRRLAIDFECNAPNIPCGVQRLRLIKEQIDVIFRSKLLQMKIQSIHSYSDVSVSKDNVRYWWGHKFLLLYSFTICFLMSLLFTRVIPNIFDLFKNYKAHQKIQATLKTQMKRYADKLYMGSTDWEIAEHLPDYYAGEFQCSYKPWQNWASKSENKFFLLH